MGSSLRRKVSISSGAPHPLNLPKTSWWITFHVVWTDGPCHAQKNGQEGNHLITFFVNESGAATNSFVNCIFRCIMESITELFEALKFRPFEIDFLQTTFHVFSNSRQHFAPPVLKLHDIKQGGQKQDGRQYES